MNSQRHNNHTAAGTAIRREATPGSGPSCESAKGRRPGSIRILRSLTFVATMAAIALALVVPVLVTSPVFADGSPSGGGTHSGGGCTSQYKVSHGESDCLGAWWDNTPPISTGVVGGSTWGAKNFCSNYGGMKAHIDLVDKKDEHFHLDSGSKKRDKDSFHNVSGISCCIDKSELCYKRQVEPVNGKINRWTEGNNRKMEWVRVKHHGERFRYCSEHPNDIYCKVNPEGDAFNVPRCGASGNTHECSADDCRSAFYDNESVSQSCTLAAWTYADGYCTLDSNCSDNGTWTFQADFEILLIDVRTRMDVCDGADGPYVIHDNDSCT